MSISIFTIEDCKKWDEIVRSFADFDVYYLSGYLRGFQIHGDGEPLLFYYKSEDGSCRGINAVMKRKISDAPEFREKKEADGLYDLATPYGYGGWLFEGAVPDKFKDEYCAFCRAKNFVSEFVRFNPMTDNGNPCRAFYNVIDLGDTVYIDLRDKEFVWNSFSSKNRNVVRKAAKEGITVKSTDEPWIVDEFMEIYNATMKRDDAADYYYFKREYYDSLFQGLKGNFRFFYAEKDGIIAAISIILIGGARLHYHLSASRKEYQKYAPTNFMLWQICNFGIENRFETFHLGGGVGSKEDSLFKFKKAFNRNENKQFAIGRAVFNKERYSQLVKCRNDIENQGFFPLYRG